MFNTESGKTKLIYRVPYADTDKMGVVYYANFLVYFERVRNEMLRNLDYSYLNLEKNGYLLPVIEAHCKYSSPAFYDDVLDISGWVGELKGAKLKILCDVFRGSSKLATGFTVHACISARTNKPLRLPREFREKICLTFFR